MLSRSPSSFHSPYLFRLFRYACNEEVVSEWFTRIEAKRKSLAADTSPLQKKDFGAGSKIDPGTATNIKNITKSAVSLPYQCRFLSRLVRYSNSKNLLELGTSLGISGAYLASADPDNKLTTIEGDPLIAERARNLFQELNLKSISLHNKTFEDYFRDTFDSNDLIDFLFIDGNHTGKSLMNYYNHLQPAIHEKSIICIDDIYWSSDMKSAWKELIDKPEVTQSVDCFQFGILFFNKEFLQKQHHRIRLPMKAFRYQI